MREDLYNRHVAFACTDGGVWSEPVKPLVGRRILTLDKDQSWQKQQKTVPGLVRLPAHKPEDMLLPVMSVEE